MPRNVRNFWLEARADGAANPVQAGPRSGDGGLDATIYQRHEGAVLDVLHISGYVSTDGTLVLDVRVPGETYKQHTIDLGSGGQTIRITTKR